MKHLRRCATLGALTLVVAAAWVALLHPYTATAQDDNPGFGQGAPAYPALLTPGSARSRSAID